MDNITITASITYPATDIEAFADARGYQAVVQNPAYSETFNSETNQIENNGESPTIPNPQSRIDFVKDWFKKQAVDMFAVDIKRNAQTQALEQAKQIEDVAKTALANAITIQ